MTPTTPVSQGVPGPTKEAIDGFARLLARPLIGTVQCLGHKPVPTLRMESPVFFTVLRRPKV